MSIVYRRATAGDAASLAKLMYLAGKSQYDDSGYDLSLGGSEAHQLTELEKLSRTNARSWFHYSHFEVAEAGGCVVAGAAGFERIIADREIPSALREIGWSETAIMDLDFRLREIYDCFPPEPVAHWTLDHVAVLEQWRGRRLARAVIERVLKKGRAEGFCFCKLDVFKGNHPARALYESIGFSVREHFGEAVMKRAIQRDGIERMILRL